MRHNQTACKRRDTTQHQAAAASRRQHVAGCQHSSCLGQAPGPNALCQIQAVCVLLELVRGLGHGVREPAEKWVQCGQSAQAAARPAPKDAYMIDQGVLATLSLTGSLRS